MAELPDLTGQNIQDTYQRILTVGDGGHMFDGTGSIFVPLSASVEVTKEISSSHADIADGLTGQPSISVTNITASGDISASGKIYGSTYLIQNVNAISRAENIGGWTGFTIGEENDRMRIVASNIRLSAPVTASSDISASGNIFGDQYKTQGHILGLYHEGSSTIRLADSSEKTEIYGTNILLKAPVTASGDISSSGNIFANRFGDNLEIIDSGNSTTLAVDSAGSAPNNGLNLSVDGITKITLRKLNYSTQFSGNTEFANAITASGDISSSGTITGIINGGTF